MKKVITVGVFDLFHFGHLRLFQNIKKMFSDECYLIVAIQDTDAVLKYKPTTKIMYNTSDRIEMIQNLKIVDEVVTYRDIDTDIKTFNFDIWARGPDQNHEGFQNAIKFCEASNKEIYVIPRTEGISSTYLKKMINDL